MTHAEQYAIAQRKEREAWDAVKLSLPGSPTFNASRWATWQASIRDVSRLIPTRKAARSTREGPSSGRAD
jgi:hypothetical protein